MNTIDRTGLKLVLKTVKNNPVVPSTGLIRARLEGAKVATGDVLVFLDAHSEGDTDWLRPLLHRIQSKKNVVLVPNIDPINEQTFLFAQASASNEVD